MPHIVVKNYKKFNTPIQKDKFNFLWFAKPLKNAKEELVAVEYENHKFLLSIKDKNSEIVIKSDKTTRISPSTIIKKAIVNFCELAKCEIIRSNISNIDEKHLKKSEEFLKTIDFFEKSFPKNKEVWIEIGFGSGRHLLYQAKQNPDIMFIGIEIHKPSIEQVLKQIEIQKLRNIYVIDYDARLFLEFVPSNIVGKIFVHFPVPWDKKPHRRVISKKFIEEAKRVLKLDGVLELRTDSKNYFDYSLELFLEQKKVKLEVTKNIEPPIVSKYEDRWLRLNKDIYDIRMINIEKSEPLKIDFDFEFKKEYNLENIVKNFDTKPKVFDDFFVHFEKLYQIDSDRYLIKISFGNFDRPEHKYLLITKNKIEYFPKKPVLSRGNIKAHKKIEEILNGK
ncbi:tRNA (guanosine(46)-N7)-methyltransferase TrmB [Nitrosophilus kaiyonis]|uniref:tRNA (guanosine(46)-N7)-methyltransferase TrmB n=1 Tax=Nitrosophilus kaiyonis TaxID=2930200 RepID=UPI00248FFEAC|nr:tRNA (guanosine(46)-N7)-methyltransferase TrmB [Nitrosophilus kaiyonis]